MATYTNPKDGKSISSVLTKEQAKNILAPLRAKNSFLNSIAGTVNAGNPSSSQIYWFYKLAEENNPNAVPISDVRVGGASLGNFARVHEAFNKAKENKIKFPKLRLLDESERKIIVSPTPLSGRNAGFIYVKVNGEYAGKISPEGVFSSMVPDENLKAFLSRFCENPMAMAKIYGQKIGQCCCCGRELSNPESVALSIGPICKNSWGF